MCSSAGRQDPSLLIHFSSVETCSDLWLDQVASMDLSLGFALAYFGISERHDLWTYIIEDLRGNSESCLELAATIVCITCHYYLSPCTT